MDDTSAPSRPGTHPGGLIASHLAVSSRALKRPGEAVSDVLLDQIGVRLLVLTAPPIRHHLIQPLVVALQTHTLLPSVSGVVPSLPFLTFTLPHVLTAKKEKVQLAEQMVSKTKVMRDSSLFSPALDTD